MKPLLSLLLALLLPLVLSINGANGSSKLNIPKVLLPLARSTRINFTLETTEGCYRWWVENCCKRFMSLLERRSHALCRSVKLHVRPHGLVFALDDIPLQAKVWKTLNSSLKSTYISFVGFYQMQRQPLFGNVVLLKPLGMMMRMWRGSDIQLRVYVKQSKLKDPSPLIQDASSCLNDCWEVSFIYIVLITIQTVSGHVTVHMPWKPQSKPWGDGGKEIFF